VEAGLFVTLGLVGFVAGVIAFASALTPASSGLGDYVHSGRFAADARTWAAMARYLLEPEPGVPTNAPEPEPTQKNLAAPTNIHNPEPKV